MPAIERHVPCTFNWFELATTDQRAAKEFYGHLFGWQAVDSPMGPDEFYTMFKLEGLDTAGGYSLRPDMRAQGIPPHWDIYIAVENAGETAAKVEAFGGKVIAPAFDVMTFGRMAVVADPIGAVFCLWQAKSHIGSRISGVDGTVCWADLNVPDVETAVKFYQGVFGWEIYKGATDESGYLHIKSGEAHIGGIPPASSNMLAHWLLYFLASDIEVVTNKAGSLGATTMLPVTEVPNTGKISVLQDPQGAVFALFEPAEGV